VAERAGEPLPRYGAQPTVSIVTAHGLVKRYGERVAVDGVELCVERGECFGLLGPNGAGKTTTLRMVYGVVRPDSGRIEVFGLDVAQHGRAVRSRLGVTLQENVIVDSLTAVENLRVFARYHLLREPLLSQRVDELVSYLELGSHAEARAETLSGGFKRRLAIAMSLLNDPELLILDEPTTGLDPAVRMLLWNKVRALKAAGKTVLLTTHYMEEAERLCDRVLIMSQGKRVCEGAPKALVSERLGREVVELDCTAEEEHALGSTLTGKTTLRAGPRLFVFGERVEGLAGQLRAALPHGAERSWVVRPANLEDLFLATTGTRLEEGA
jgi:lipooligosaccharide transport system ATP-binding protein